MKMTRTSYPWTGVWGKPWWWRVTPWPWGMPRGSRASVCYCYISAGVWRWPVHPTPGQGSEGSLGGGGWCPDPGVRPGGVRHLYIWGQQQLEGTSVAQQSVLYESRHAKRALTKCSCDVIEKWRHIFAVKKIDTLRALFAWSGSYSVLYKNNVLFIFIVCIVHLGIFPVSLSDNNFFNCYNFGILKDRYFILGIQSQLRYVSNDTKGSDYTLMTKINFTTWATLVKSHG